MNTPPLPTRPPVPVRPANIAPWDVKRELFNIARAVRFEGMSADDSEQRRNDLYNRANVKDASGYERYFRTKALPHAEYPSMVKAALQYGMDYAPVFLHGEIENAPSIDRWPGTNRPMTFRHQVMLLSCVYLECECCGRPFLFARETVRQYWRELRHEELDARHFQRFVEYARKRGLLSVESSWTPSNRHARPSRFTLTGDWWKDYLPTVQT